MTTVTPPTESDAITTAFIDDYISLPSSYHKPAYVTFSWTADGTGVGSLFLGWGSDCVQNIVSSSATCTLTQELQPGDRANLQVILTANASVRVSGSAGNEVSETSDFSHTAILTEVGIFDQNMNPLTGVQLVSDSGFAYQNNVLSETPEPTSFWLMLGGAIIGGLFLKSPTRIV